MVFHLTAAAHDIAAARIEDTVAGTAGNIHCLKNMDMIARHLTVTYEEAGCCKRSKAAAYDIGIFLINAVWFFRACKCFVVSVGIIDSLAVFVVTTAFCVAVAVCGCLLFLFRSLIIFFLCEVCSSESGCKYRCCCKFFVCL